jgi:hypothetical protein
MIITMHDIESQLAALKPTRQPELARRILDIPHRRWQRRRDCFVGLAGLLTGIAATVVVMVSFAAKVEPVYVVQIVERQQTADGRQQQNDEPAKVPVVIVKNVEPIDLDAMIAQYEKMLRHRQEWASKQIAVTPRVVSVSSGGVSRDELMKEFGG